MTTTAPTAEDLTGLHGRLGFINFRETTEGPAPARAWATRLLADFEHRHGDTVRRLEGRDEVELGTVVLVHSYGRVRAGLVVGLGPKRAKVRLTTPAAVDRAAGRPERDLDEVLAKYRRRREEAATRYLGQSQEDRDAGQGYSDQRPHWDRCIADTIYARAALEGRGITGRDAVVAWATDVSTKAVPYTELLVAR